MKSTLLLATALAAFTFSDAAWAASMHTMVFTSSGTFTIPATAAAGTEFEFTVIGGGGGGGGCSTGIFQAASGGSGGAGFASYSGFTASQTIAVTIGAGGANGAFGGGAGGGGGTSKLVFGTTTAAQSAGGGGGKRADPGREARLRRGRGHGLSVQRDRELDLHDPGRRQSARPPRSEEHTSE